MRKKIFAAVGMLLLVIGTMWSKKLYETDENKRE